MEVINTRLPFLGVASSLIGGRAENQDTYLVAETADGYLAVVCDGMGGGPGGKTASAIAAATIIDFILNRSDLAEGATPATNSGELLIMAVQAANTALRNKIREVPELNGMGTTATVVLASPQCATIAHVGDSRVYQLRNRKIAFRTTDHSKVGEMVAMGTLTEEQARLSAFSNIITRALGVADSVEVDIDIRPYEKGDRFVLCTDGIWGVMPQPELVKLLTRGPKSLQGTIDTLNLIVETAGKEKGGHHDNYTIILFETKKDSIMKEPLSKHTRLLIYILSAICGISILLNIIFFCMPTKTDITKERNEALKELRQQNAVIDSLNQVLKSKVQPISAKTSVTAAAKQKSDSTVDQKFASAAAAEKAQNLIKDLNYIKKQVKNLGDKKKPERADAEKIVKSIINVEQKFCDFLSEDEAKQLKDIRIEVKKDATTKKDNKGQCIEIENMLQKLIDKIKARQ